MITIMVVAAVSVQPSRGQALTDGLVFLHNFSGNTADSSGNGLDLDVYGATLTADRFGVSNSAYFFDGVDDYMEIPASQQIQVDPPVSFSCWVKTESLLQTDIKIFRTDERAYNYDGYFLNGWGNDNGELVLSAGGGLGDTSPANRRSKSTDSTINISQWHNIICVINDPLDMEIYVDCVNAAGTYSGSGPVEVSHSGSTGRFGSALAVFGVGETFFHGELDQFAMWSRALQFSDVTKICSGELEGLIPVGKETEPPEVVRVTNPVVSQMLTIELKADQRNVDAKILDMSGRIVDQRSLDQTKTEWQLEDLPSGLYFLRIEVDSKVTVRRIILI